METREKILQAAGELFVTQGLKKTTMDTVANNLGISKRTLYENFKNKEELVKSFLLETMLDHKSKLLAIINASENVIEALIQFGHFNRDLFSRINPIYFEDLKKYYAPIFDSTVNSNRVRNFEVSYLILKRGVNEGIFTKEIDIDIANKFIHNTMEHFFRLDQKESVSHAKVFQTIFYPYIKGICTEKGLEIIKSMEIH